MCELDHPQIVCCNHLAHSMRMALVHCMARVVHCAGHQFNLLSVLSCLFRCLQVKLVGVCMTQRPWLVCIELMLYGDVKKLLLVRMPWLHCRNMKSRFRTYSRSRCQLSMSQNVCSIDLLLSRQLVGRPLVRFLLLLPTTTSLPFVGCKIEESDLYLGRAFTPRKTSLQWPCFHHREGNTRATTRRRMIMTMLW